MSRQIDNPILKGFNPDPSICRVGDDYYLATSTFEWYPGVQIHHSGDLVNWRLLMRPLARESLLDMRGVPDFCGVWAPCLTHADGLFWLIYTRVNRFDGNFRNFKDTHNYLTTGNFKPIKFKDTHNYLTTCDRIDGEWSEPVYLNNRGFDPSSPLQRCGHGDWVETPQGREEGRTSPAPSWVCAARTWPASPWRQTSASSNTGRWTDASDPGEVLARRRPIKRQLRGLDRIFLLPDGSKRRRQGATAICPRQGTAGISGRGHTPYRELRAPNRPVAGCGAGAPVDEQFFSSFRAQSRCYPGDRLHQ